MRLCDLLSKPPQHEYQQVEGFLVNKKCRIGQQIDLDVGTIGLNYFCKECDNQRTFSSQGKIRCICVDHNKISIDSVLACSCGEKIEAWFLIESEEEINKLNPKVKIIKRSEHLNENVESIYQKYGAFSKLLEKAEQAYWCGFGAGAIVYLRKIYETVLIEIADRESIEYGKHDNGSPGNFSKLLKMVDEKYKIVPTEFEDKRYRLFEELSGVVHGAYNDEEEMKKFEPLKRLVIGILDNVQNKSELQEALACLGWDNEKE